VIAVIGRRTCALGAMCSAVLHGVSLCHAANAAAAVLMAAMIVGCIYCARDLWISDALRGWTLVAVMNLVMIGIHLPATSVHHHGGGAAVAAMAPQSTAMTLATAFAAAEAIVATAVLFYRTRRISSVECPTSPSPSCVRASMG
jgi:hypothetical protein